LEWLFPEFNETIKIMKQIDETIAAPGGWPIK